jgi:hypothetical protein
MLKSKSTRRHKKGLAGNVQCLKFISSRGNVINAFTQEAEIFVRAFSNFGILSNEDWNHEI